MRTESTDSFAPPSVQIIAQGAAVAPLAHDGGNGHGPSHADAGSSATDFLQIESIVLNLDASLRVHGRAHFFSWTQGLLQSLIRHELLICTLCHGKPPAFRADGFSMWGRVGLAAAVAAFVPERRDRGALRNDLYGLGGEAVG